MRDQLKVWKHTIGVDEVTFIAEFQASTTKKKPLILYTG